MVHSLDVILFNSTLDYCYVFFGNFIEVGYCMFLLLMVVDLGLPSFFMTLVHFR